MFNPTGLFKNIPCPGGDKCESINCIFSHEVLRRDRARSNGASNKTSTETSIAIDEPASKRRKLDTVQADNAAEVAEATQNHESIGTSEDKQGHDKTVTRNTSTSAASTKLPGSLKRPISPPATIPKPENGLPAKAIKTMPVRKETLNPRMLPTPPAGHDKRTLYLKYLHEQLKRLNMLVTNSDNPQKSKLVLDDQELIKASLDEEIELAKTSSTVYPNHIKQRIGYFKKMIMDDWIVYIKTNIFASKQKDTDGSALKTIDTGLSSTQEYEVLKQKLLTPPEQLKKLGFVLSPPTADEIEEAERLVLLTSNWEVCDRCRSRFQVFPDRREEDGAVTTNGPCTYHWGRLRRPKRERTDAITGAKESVYTCCGELANTPGCVTVETHVYKVSGAGRMASVLPFIDTPPNETRAKMKSGRTPLAITFDCEMGYTSLGLELIRLTAVSWPENEEAIDVLVRPKGTILDFNTRFSGIKAETFRDGIEWREEMGTIPSRGKGGEVSLPIVSSPEEARRLLCSFISPETPLMGHALENDLNSIRLCHPTVLDTCALYPHPRGLPIRHGLKQLALVHLGKDIQTGGEAGHDSKEDAVAAGDLVRVRVGKVWESMKKGGWKFDGEKLVAPPAKL